MKQKHFNLAGFVLAAVISMALLSCDMIDELFGTEDTNTKSNSGKKGNKGNKDKPTVPGDTDDPYVDELTWHVDLSDEFDEWTASATGTGSLLPIIVTENGRTAIEFDATPMEAGGRSSFSRTLDFTEDTEINFIYKTDIQEFVYANSFKLYIDGNLKASYEGTASGLDTDWKSDSIMIPVGSHEIKWVLENNSGSSLKIATNKVWLATDIAFTPDVTAYLEISPRGHKDTYMGGFDIQYTAKAFRPNGSLRSGATGITFGGAGVDSTTGLLTPTTPGTYRVTASLDEKTVSSDTVTVHPADYMREPYTNPVTGKTWNGNQGSPNSFEDFSLRINLSQETPLLGDGFITVEGETFSSTPSRMMLDVTKDGDPDSSTRYWIGPGNFVQRIWLRFGPGDYKITISSFYKFTVTNTCTDTGVNNAGAVSDPRFLYPSAMIQSDDFRITNLLTDILYGVTNEADKIKIIHDYMVKNTVYDVANFLAETIPDQDALTILGTRHHFDPKYEPDGHYMAVCEGYTLATAALLRAAGIQTRYVSGQVASGLHAWNNVYTGGKWKFLDVTWDDPVNLTTGLDSGPSYVRYMYYLLDDLGGVNNDHYDYAVNNYRSVVPVLPKMRGMPDGWY